MEGLRVTAADVRAAWPDVLQFSAGCQTLVFNVVHKERQREPRKKKARVPEFDSI
jgi:hypothetical protein